MRILVAEDEPDLAATLARALDEEGFSVDLAADGEEALYHARETGYAGIVLDLMLPRIDGWTVLTTLREAGDRTPVLILTARDGVEERVRGLNLGADDYLIKPFALRELVARLRALIRRSTGDADPVLAFGDVRVDTVARRVERAGQPVDLTAREYAILELLAHRRGALVTRRVIQEQLYDDWTDVQSNAVDVHIAALRRKLGPGVIETRRGHGYMIDG